MDEVVHSFILLRPRCAVFSQSALTNTGASHTHRKRAVITVVIYIDAKRLKSYYTAQAKQKEALYKHVLLLIDDISAYLMRTYEEIRGFKPDFLVSYRLYSPSEGGRKVTYQHLRCDFMYEGDDPAQDGIYMIHPEFLDQYGYPLGEEHPVPLEGKAYMWVLVPEMRASTHKSRISVGTRGHFMEGARKIGDVKVEQILALRENPQSS